MTDTIERPQLKVTYATLRNDNEELHEQFEHGMAQARTQLGKHYANFINGEPRQGEGEFEDRAPIDDSLVVGYFAKGTRQDAKDAIAAARALSPAGATPPGGSAGRSSAARRDSSPVGRPSNCASLSRFSSAPVVRVCASPR